MGITQQQIADRTKWALEHSTLCPAPHTTIDVRHSDDKKQKIFQTCCCNLDAALFVPVEGTDVFAEIKQQQLNGQWPSACHKCQQEEQNGGQSERVRSFVELPQDRFESFVEDQSIGEFEFRIKFFKLSIR